MAGKTDRFMPLEIEPWTKKTARLSAAARGAYMDLLLAYWRGEELPANDDDALMRLARCTETEWKAVWPKVRPFFFQDGDVLRQARADEEKAKANQNYETKASNGEAGGKASGKQRRSKKEANDKANTEAEPKQTASEPPSASEHTSTLEHSSDEESPPVVPKGTALPRAFAEWYSGEGIDGYDGYPHKVGRDAALRAWEKRAKEGTLPDVLVLIDATERYIASKNPEHSYANPATWIAQARWLDQPAPRATGAASVAPTLVIHDEEGQWRARVLSWMQSPKHPDERYWNTAWGPPPHHLDTHVPRKILDETGACNELPPRLARTKPTVAA